MRSLALKVLMLSLFLLMIPGCSGTGFLDDPLKALTGPVVVEQTTAIACPEFAVEDVKKGEISVDRPAAWKKKGVTKKELLGHVDVLEKAVTSRNDTIKRMTAEHYKCRNPTTPAATATPAAKAKPPTT